LKILYVNKISPFTIGGAEVRLWEISRRLASRGHEVHVVCGKNFPKLPAHQRVDGVHIRNVTVLPAWVFRFRKLSFFLAQYLFYFLSLPAIFISARKVDVVIDCATPVVSGAGVVSKLLRKPCVVMTYNEPCGLGWFRLRGPVTATLGYLAERYFFTQEYDSYMTLSQHTIDRMVDLGKPRERIHHLCLSVGVDRPARPGQPTAERLPEVTCISRLVKMKNIASLLKAWKLVTVELGGARLRIIGDGPERKNLEKLADVLSISESVTFEGELGKRKWALLDQASAFAFPSLQEGFGFVMVEAMAAGLPVVAYDLPVFREFLTDGEHGYLVPLDDHRQMADRLLELLRDDELRREMSHRNAEYARQFTWERAADQEESALLHVLAGRHRNPR